jgi:hypothetical protein
MKNEKNIKNGYKGKITMTVQIWMKFFRMFSYIFIRTFTRILSSAINFKAILDEANNYLRQIRSCFNSFPLLFSRSATPNKANLSFEKAGIKSNIEILRFLNRNSQSSNQLNNEIRFIIEIPITNEIYSRMKYIQGRNLIH